MPGGQTYQRYKEEQAQRNLELSAQGRDIAPVPEVAKPRRKSRCKKSLQGFCETYLAERFPLAWSADHLKAIGKLEACVLKGGQFALAMPRGSGKTSLSEAAALWALCYAHRSFVALVGANDAKAAEMLDSLKMALETNETLLADFPEVCYPIHKLQGISNRCRGQTCNGEPTRIGWTQDEVVLPTLPGHKTSGARVRVSGLTGSSIRGMKAALEDGRIIRPDVAIVDDPSTDDSATSVTQNATRERLICGAILGMAGPKKKMSCIVPCTVIAPGDLADRLLDRQIHPEWNGERTKMVYSFPTNTSLWEEYAKVRGNSLRAGNGGKEATEFYRANRAAMDEGAQAAWAERFNPDELSAIQHAMNLKIDNPRAFAAEYQNEPLVDLNPSGFIELKPADITAKINRIPRGIVPRECTRITAAIDVQKEILYWMVCAWSEDFSGAIIDRGSFPEQNRSYYSASDARPGLSTMFPGVVDKAAIYAGLAKLVPVLLANDFEQDGTGAKLKVEKLLIDAGYWTDTIYQFCREAKQSAVIFPSKGYGIPAHKVTVDEWPVKVGERVGLHWRIGAPEAGRGRVVKIDTYPWKSFVNEQLRIPPGSPGCLRLFGDENTDHQMLADHLTSEYRVMTEGRGRKFPAWENLPGRENHWWDCLVYATVAASVAGIVWTATGQPVVKKAKRIIDIGDLYKKARAGV